MQNYEIIYELIEFINIIMNSKLFFYKFIFN